MNNGKLSLSDEELVERVRAYSQAEAAVCLQHWVSSIGPSYFEVGSYLIPRSSFQ